MKKLIFTILLAAVLWTVMFSPWTAPFVNFWWMMTGSALTLSVLSLIHISEPTRQAEISYAVFCLKKKKQILIEKKKKKI